MAKVDKFDSRGILKKYLVRNFSYGLEYRDFLDKPIVHEGFEDLNAELLVMLGDESFTSAFASRFDLARLNIAAFEGSKFEPNGMDLEGGAGFEMYKFYQAAQYYQKALDRFYRLTPSIWSSIGKLPDGQGFITPATVASWLDRLISSSSKKTRVWNEISKRYQKFNRPDLARIVIERAYTSAHLESIVLSTMMLRIIDQSSSTYAAQVTKQIEMAQRTYRVAMLDMYNTYKDISDDVTYFGFPPDYIPFPALYPLDLNAFTKILTIARQKMEIANAKEMRALEGNRQFETSSEMFQSEIRKIERDYENQLMEICGSFTVTLPGSGTQVYPAIPKYAQYHKDLKEVGNPCGLVGNGAIFESMSNLTNYNLNYDTLITQRGNLLNEIKDADLRTKAQCSRVESIRDIKLQNANRSISLKKRIHDLNTAMNIASSVNDYATNMAKMAKCSIIAGLAAGGDCPTSGIAIGLMSAAFTAYTAATISKQVYIADMESDIMDLEVATLADDYNDQCTQLKIEVQYNIKSLYRRLVELEHEFKKNEEGTKLAISSIQKLQNKAMSLVEQMNESTEMTINVEATRNDPNVRIYRNDDVIASDRTFYDALKEAYRLTKIYEYYTSQSYAAMDMLHLIRMVSHGDYTLERYIADLSQAFNDFEEAYGIPDDRVAMISLKNDILLIPTLDKNGVALKSTDRTKKLRNKLKDVTLLDENGYITIPFSTTLNLMSPLTGVHKINYIEADIQGTDLGDQIARIYVRQRGTGTVRNLEGGNLFYAFPERTAVINTYFNGVKYFSPPDVYQNKRFRDRPFVNTEWELVINLKDEYVNGDINLSGITDIRLFIYYSDFTRE